MKKVIIDCATGEQTLVDLTAEEITQQEADAISSEEYQSILIALFLLFLDRKF